MTNAATADLTQLVQNMRGSKRVVQRQAAELIGKAASEVQQKAQALAPKKTGKLSQSIQVRWAGPTKAIVGPGVFYGVFQEFGTGERGELKGHPYTIRPTKGKNLTFKVNGKWVSTKIVHHPGIKAHPYMRPAAREVLTRLAPELAKTAAITILRG